MPPYAHGTSAASYVRQLRERKAKWERRQARKAAEAKAARGETRKRKAAASTEKTRKRTRVENDQESETGDGETGGAEEPKEPERTLSEDGGRNGSEGEALGSPDRPEVEAPAAVVPEESSSEEESDTETEQEE